MKKAWLRLKSSWRVLLLLAAALGLRVYIAGLMHPVIHTDSITFLFLHEVDMVRTPGYPLFLEALFGLNDLFSLTSDYFRLICYGQLFLLGVLNSFLVYRLSLLLARSRNFGLAMGIIYNFNFFVVSYEFQILTETLSLTLFLAVLTLSLRLFQGRLTTALLVGGLSGLLLLTRATFQFLGVAMPFLVLAVYYPLSFKKKFLKRIGPSLAIFLAVNILVIAGWSLRNKVKYDYFGISSLMPYQLRYYTNDLFEKYKPGKDEHLNSVARIYAEEYQKTGGASATLFNFHKRLYEEMKLSDARIARDFMKVNLKLIRDYPAEYLKQVPRSLRSYYQQYSMYWASGNTRKFFGRGGPVGKVLRGFFRVYEKLFTRAFLLLLTVVVAPVVLFLMVWRNRRSLYGWLLVAFAVHYNCLVSVLSTNAGINNLRYRAPAEPLILLMLYAALYLAGKKVVGLIIRRRARRPEAGT